MGVPKDAVFNSIAGILEIFDSSRFYGASKFEILPKPAILAKKLPQ